MIFTEDIKGYNCFKIGRTVYTILGYGTVVGYQVPEDFKEYEYNAPYYKKNIPDFMYLVKILKPEELLEEAKKVHDEKGFIPFYSVGHGYGYKGDKV
jgi:hypothetical protein